MKKLVHVSLIIGVAVFVSSFNKKMSPRPETLESLETKYSEKLPLQTNLGLTIASAGYHLNDAVTFEAVVNPVVKISQKPTGTVTFTANGTKICTAVPIDSASYKASCTIQNKIIGAYSIVATYSGAKDFYSPSRSSLKYSVSKLASKTDLTVMPITSNTQQSWNLVAKVNRMSVSIPVTGTVSFFVNTQPIPSCVNKSIQNATCQYIAKNTDAAIEFSAQYSGDSHYAISSMQKNVQRKDGLNLELLTNEFNYNQNSSENGFDFSVRISGNYNGKEIFNLKDNLTFAVAGMKSTENYLMEKDESIFDSQEYKNVRCEMSFNSLRTGIVATCYSLRPVVSEFNITIVLKTNGQDIIASETFPIKIHSKMSKTQISNTNSPANGCGLKGTTRQRIFDCSMIVSNSVGQPNAQEKFVSYKAGELSTDFNWFLVYCPQKSSSQSCSWLSPVLEAGNPVLSKGEFDTNGVSMGNYQGQRILWSGVSDGVSTFFQANGNGTNTFQFTEYPLVNESTMAKSSGGSRQLSSSVCKTGKGLPLFSLDNPYNWQVPSYPMIMSLTGGKYCDGIGVGFEQDWKAFCNGGSTPQGSRAILVPSFVKTYLWSSSVDSKNQIAWIFNGTDGGADVTTYDDGCSVRCASFTW